MKLKGFLRAASAFSSLLLAAAPSAQAGTTYYYTPQTVGNYAGRVFYDALTPINQMGFNLSGQSDGATGPVTGWNLGNFTGANSPNPVGNYQYGLSSYGGASVSMFDQGTEPVFGVMMNSWSFPYNPATELSGTYLQYRFCDAQNVRPFSYGPSSVLHYSHMLQVPQAYTQSGGRAYVIQGITFADNVSGMYFWFGPLAFDTGFTTGVEGIQLDLGTSAYIAGTYFGSNTAYMTRANSSFSTTNQTWQDWHWYGYSVNYSQMIRMITDINAQITATCQQGQTCRKFSLNPEDYQIGMLYVGGEVTRPIPTNTARHANMGYSTYGHWLYVTY